ncbi:hypothetical protein [Streptomyces sp. c-19]|uniref:hypothetical protein n=1 Tax=Streptomyces sp. c-19 TaxID=2789275 RepID=UPI00397EB3A8
MQLAVRGHGSTDPADGVLGSYSRAVIQGCPRGSGYSGLIGEVPDTHAYRALGNLVS